MPQNPSDIPPPESGDKRVAVVDLGTNTFNLLVADVTGKGFHIVYSKKEGVALGMGGINEGVIAGDAFLRGMETMQRFRDTCDELSVEEIYAFGTSALRDAENSLAFRQEVSLRTGIEVRVISGDKEAELIYRGVQWSYDFSERAVIMDIGGGSTEFIVAGPDGIEEKISLDIGVSRIFQDLELGDPLTLKDVEKIEQWLEERAEGFFDDKRCDILIGASGSFETFYEMIHREKFPPGIKALEIPMDQLHHIMDWVITSNQAERDHHPFIIPIRRRMAPIAAVKARWVMNKLLVEKVLVSPCSLKEGALSGL